MKVQNISTHLIYIDGKNVFPEDTVEINDSFAEIPAVHAMVRTKELLIVEMPVEKKEEEPEVEVIEDKPKKIRRKKAE